MHFRAVRHDRRAGEHESAHVDPRRGLDPLVLLLEDDPRAEVGTPSAVLGGPVQGRVPGFVELALPLAVGRKDSPGFRVGEIVTRRVRLEPFADLRAPLRQPAGVHPDGRVPGRHSACSSWSIPRGTTTASTMWAPSPRAPTIRGLTSSSAMSSASSLASSAIANTAWTTASTSRSGAPRKGPSSRAARSL